MHIMILYLELELLAKGAAVRGQDGTCIPRVKTQYCLLLSAQQPEPTSSIQVTL